MKMAVSLGVHVVPCKVRTRHRCAPPGLVPFHVYEVAPGCSGGETVKLPVANPSSNIVRAINCSLPGIRAGTQVRSATPVREPAASQRGCAASCVAAPDPPTGPTVPSKWEVCDRVGVGEPKRGDVSATGDTPPVPPAAPQPSPASTSNATAITTEPRMAVTRPYVRTAANVTRSVPSHVTEHRHHRARPAAAQVPVIAGVGLHDDDLDSVA